VQQKELIQHARDEGLKFITDTSSKTEEGLYRLLETHIIKPLREQSYIHVEKTVAKSVSTSMITDEMRSGYSPTQRSNDLIAGLRVARAPVRWFYRVDLVTQPAKHYI